MSLLILLLIVSSVQFIYGACPAPHHIDLPSYNSEDSDLVAGVDVRMPDGSNDVMPSFVYAGYPLGMEELLRELTVESVLHVPVPAPPAGEDATDALFHALDLVTRAGGGVLELGAGDFELREPLMIVQDNVVIRGKGSAQTRILYKGVEVTSQAGAEGSVRFIGMRQFNYTLFPNFTPTCIFYAKGVSRARLYVNDVLLNDFDGPQTGIYYLHQTLLYSPGSQCMLPEEGREGMSVEVRCEVEWFGGSTTKSITQTLTYREEGAYTNILKRGRMPGGFSHFRYGIQLLGHPTSVSGTFDVLKTVQRGDSHAFVSVPDAAAFGATVSQTEPYTIGKLHMLQSVLAMQTLGPSAARGDSAGSINLIIDSWREATTEEASELTFAVPDGAMAVRVQFTQPVRHPMVVSFDDTNNDVKFSLGAYITRSALVGFYFEQVPNGPSVHDNLQHGGVEVANALYCVVHDVHIRRVGRWPFSCGQCKNTIVDSCFFDEAWNTHQGGYVIWGFSDDNLIHNNTGYALRHAPDLQRWSTGNVMRRCSWTASDQQHHRNYAFENLLEASVVDDRNVELFHGMNQPYGGGKVTGSYGYGIYAHWSPAGELPGSGPRNVYYNEHITSASHTLMTGQAQQHLFHFNYVRQLSPYGPIASFNYSYRHSIYGNMFAYPSNADNAFVTFIPSGTSSLSIGCCGYRAAANTWQFDSDAILTNLDAAFADDSLYTANQFAPFPDRQPPHSLNGLAPIASLYAYQMGLPYVSFDDDAHARGDRFVHGQALRIRVRAGVHAHADAHLPTDGVGVARVELLLNRMVVQVQCTPVEENVYEFSLCLNNELLGSAYEAGARGYYQLLLEARVTDTRSPPRTELNPFPFQVNVTLDPSLAQPSFVTKGHSRLFFWWRADAGDLETVDDGGVARVLSWRDRWNTGLLFWSKNESVITMPMYVPNAIGANGAVRFGRGDEAKRGLRSPNLQYGDSHGDYYDRPWEVRPLYAITGLMPRTMIVVARHLSFPAGRADFVGVHWQHSFECRPDTTLNVRSGVNDNPGLWTTAPGVCILDKAQVFVAVFDGVRSRMYVDGALVLEDTYAPEVQAYPMLGWPVYFGVSLGHIAYDYGSYGFEGEIFELMLFRSALSDENRIELEAELAMHYCDGCAPRDWNPTCALTNSDDPQCDATSSSKAPTLISTTGVPGAPTAATDRTPTGGAPTPEVAPTPEMTTTGDTNVTDGLDGIAPSILGLSPPLLGAILGGAALCLLLLLVLAVVCVCLARRRRKSHLGVRSTRHGTSARTSRSSRYGTARTSYSRAAPRTSRTSHSSGGNIYATELLRRGMPPPPPPPSRF